MYGCYYGNSISDDGRVTLEWRSCILKAIRTRAIYPRHSSPDIVIFTDDAATSMIMDSVVSRKVDFDADASALSCRGIASGAGWAEYFSRASLIYGLELTALLLTTADPDLPLGGLSIAYYIDNNNAKCALVRVGSRILAISLLAHILGHLCYSSDYPMARKSTHG